MSEPIVFISRHKVKEGMVEEFRRSYRDNTPAMEADKPGTVVFLHYFDEDESEVTSLHVFPDAEAMEHHMEGASERAGKAWQFLVPGRFEIYGKPNEKVLEFMKQAAAGSGASLSVKPEFVAGYLRLKSG
jgi:quinol monooxygenase YgiN